MSTSGSWASIFRTASKFFFVCFKASNILKYFVEPSVYIHVHIYVHTYRGLLRVLDTLYIYKYT